jgi:hypothetical protein
MEQLLKHLIDLSSAIELCLARKQLLPSLILLYSSIDIVSSLEPMGNKGRSRFVRWVETYLLPASPLKCTAIEIYAARCGVVHTMTSESDLSVKGKHRMIWYAWGNHSADDLEKLVDLAGRANEGVAVHVDQLYEAFLSGVVRWADELKADPDRRSAVEGQGKKWFTNIRYQT